MRSLSNKKKVLFFLPPNVGGAERMTITYAKLLDKNKYDIKFVVVGRERGDIVKFIPEEYEVLFIKTRNIYDFVTFRIYRLLKKECPDIVFCSLMFLNPRVIAASKFKGNFYTIVRNDNSVLQLKLINKLLVRLFYQKTDVIILQTQEMYNEIKKWFGDGIEEKLTIIPNPIDKQTIDNNISTGKNPYDDSFTNYVFVGRISHVKGIDVLLNAFVAIIDKIPNARLYIVGKVESEDYYQSLLEFIKKNNISDRVIFAGFQTNPHIYIKHANCLVLPSRVEGMPNVVIDAMYLKTPVVVTRSVPVIEELVDDEHGITIPVDDVKAMSKAMYNILNLDVKDSYDNISSDLVKQIFVI